MIDAGNGVNVETASAYPGSVLNLYRRLLEVRRNSPALRLGSWRPRPAPDGVLAYARQAEDDRRVVLINYTAAAVDVDIDGDLTIEVSSDGEREGAIYKGRLGPDQAIVLSDAPPTA